MPDRRHNVSAPPDPSRLATGARSRSRRGLLGALCLAQLMVILDISAVNVALPALASDLRLGPTELSWTITSYSLVFGSLLLLGGRAADLLGRRRVFLTGLMVFTVSSLGSALAASAPALFLARGGQGLGAALLSPAALSIITATFDKGSERTRALGVWGAVGGAGAAIGVLLGGVLTELIGWRAIFVINLPIGLVVGIAALRIVPAGAALSRRGRLDLPGAVMATAGLGALVFALSQAQTAGWSSLRTIGVGAAGLAGLVAFTFYERRAPNPLLRVGELADRAVGGGLAMMLAAAAVLFGSFLLSSLYLQEVVGASALVTGLGFLPLALTIGAGVHAGTRLINQHGVRVPLAAGFAITAAGMFMLTGVRSHGTYFADLLPGMLVAAAGLGLVLVSVSVSILAGAREEHSGMLSGLNTTGHEIGGSLGLALLTTIATAGLDHAHPGRAASAVAGGLGRAFLAAGIIAAAAAVVAVLVLPRAKAFLPKLALAPPVSIH